MRGTPVSSGTAIPSSTNDVACPILPMLVRADTMDSRWWPAGHGYSSLKAGRVQHFEADVTLLQATVLNSNIDETNGGPYNMP